MQSTKERLQKVFRNRGINVFVGIDGGGDACLYIQKHLRGTENWRFLSDTELQLFIQLLMETLAESDIIKEDQ